jgi:hypothetical protein
VFEILRVVFVEVQGWLEDSLYTATTNDHSVGEDEMHAGMPTSMEDKYTTYTWGQYPMHCLGKHCGRTVYMFGTGPRISVDNKLKIGTGNLFMFAFVILSYLKRIFPFSMQSLMMGIS